MSPACPACGGRMRKRVNRETREAFWGCSGYPQCRGSVSWGGEDWGGEARRGVFTGGPAVPPSAVLGELERLREHCAALEREVTTLRGDVRRLQVPAWPQAVVVRELTRLIAVCHPDRWGGESRVATQLTQALLALRAKLQAGAGA